MDYTTVRLRALYTWPFLAKYFCNMKPVSVEGLYEQAGTPMACDKHFRLYYDPAEIRRRGVEDCASLMLHEAEHLRRFDAQSSETKIQLMGPAAHISRKELHKLMNVCQDAAINDDIEEQLTKPLRDEGVFPEKLPKMFGNLVADCAKDLGQRGKMWQHYFDLVFDRIPRSQEDSGCFPGPSKNKEGQDEKDGQNQPPQKGRGGRPIQTQDHNCGSCATGEAAPWELGFDDPNAPGVSEIEARVIQRQTAEEITKAANRGIGNIPQHLVTWAQETLAPPKVPWQSVLRTAIARGLVLCAGKSDFTFSRISRRTSYAEFRLPGTVSFVPEIVMVHDTSGSMGDRNQRCLVHSELEGIIKSYEPRVSVKVLSVDVIVHQTVKIRNAKKLSTAGGGGTDMSTGIEAAAVLKPRPSIIIVATDCETGWPKKKPKGISKVIICAVEADAHWVNKCPDWATVVEAK